GSPRKVRTATPSITRRPSSSTSRRLTASASRAGWKSRTRWTRRSPRKGRNRPGFRPPRNTLLCLGPDHPVKGGKDILDTAREKFMSKRQLILVSVVVILALAAAGAWFAMGRGGGVGSATAASGGLPADTVHP